MHMLFKQLNPRTPSAYDHTATSSSALVCSCLRPRGRPPPWCARRGAAVWPFQHGQHGQLGEAILESMTVGTHQVHCRTQASASLLLRFGPPIFFTQVHPADIWDPHHCQRIVN
jgi:hypothetical protein